MRNEDILDMFKDGFSASAIARKCRMSYQRVKRILQDAGVYKKYYGKLTENEDDVIAKYNSGEKVEDIAKEYGVSLVSVINFLRKKGVKMRGKGQKRKIDIEKLKEYIASRGCVKIIEIANHFNVSEITARKAVKELDEKYLKMIYRK